MEQQADVTHNRPFHSVDSGIFSGPLVRNHRKPSAICLYSAVTG